ncbi:MAG TPA: pyridoxal-phosphate dependent enzyme [Thermomicrobiales bacterium]|nr:pyridoxal-phosphate dependent enzyme [Thermomicrobiales bacterium]
MPRNVARPSSNHLSSAREIVSRYLRPTPLVQARDSTWLKLETMQPTGAFKVRGALNALTAIEPGTRIVTASAGNHALGVAWASRKLGVPATIVVAETAASVKIEKLRDLGADLVIHGDTYDEAEAHGIALAANGGHFLSAYNDTYVIAGQSTVLDEIMRQLPDDSQPVTIVVPVGGGGLLSGIALRAAEIADREITLLGVEAEESQAVSAGVRAGHTVEVPIGETLADGLSGNAEPGSVTVDIIRDHGIELVTATEDEIRGAIRALAFDHGVIAEGASATAYATMTRLTREGHVVRIITGRNISWPVLRDVLDAR